MLTIYKFNGHINNNFTNCLNFFIYG